MRGRQNPDLDAIVSLRDARDLKHLAVVVEDADSCHRLALQKLLGILWCVGEEGVVGRVGAGWGSDGG